jgi:hypothetical protein
MREIKIGDVVRCIGMEDLYNDKLEIGAIYTIGEMAKPNWFRVNENGRNNCFHSSCFEHVSPDTQVGAPIAATKLACVSHVYKEYVGFTERFSYCVNCDHKERA